MLQSSGLAATLFTVFVAGILVSFTPCVYPMIPITLGIIGARSAGQKPLRGFLLSSVFVLGIAVIYCALGLVAAKTGKPLSFIFQQKWFVMVLAVFFGAMGLSMMGLFEIQLPASFTGRLQSGANRGGFVGAFLLGLVTGIVASPCGTPVLVSILGLAAQSGQETVAVAMLFVYALGIGMLFLVLGAFPAFLGALPKSGAWMEDIRKLLGVILIGVAVFYLQYVVPVWLFWGVVVGASLLGGVLAAVGAGRRQGHPYLQWAWRAAAVLLVGIALWAAFAQLPKAMIPARAPAATQADATQGGVPETWLADEAKGLELAAKLGKPTIVDFGAEWCAACKELEHKTFPAPEVAAVLKDFVKVRIDCTEETTQTQALQKKYGSRALPTVAFVDKTGRILPDLTLFKFEPPSQFLERLGKVPR